jgi:hypothetical protein
MSSIFLRQACAGRGDRAAAHVPLPRITMSKSRLGRELPSCQRSNTARKTLAQRAAWAAYIGVGFYAVKPQIAQAFRFFARDTRSRSRPCP